MSNKVPWSSVKMMQNRTRSSVAKVRPPSLPEAREGFSLSYSARNMFMKLEDGSLCPSHGGGYIRQTDPYWTRQSLDVLLNKAVT